ncbi:MAG: CDP-alcohol phosphatidyltransferase family protein [Ruminiclostridium sp.]|nr:CDP-alcohol phosphatidyltransferase family protein [Ruminiclostridium sp.]
MRKHLANLVTSCRILCGVGLLFCPVFSPSFWGLYLVGGLTDMVDGTIARKLNSATGFGSKLDSAADLVFVVAACCKLLPVIHLPGWIWCWVVLIAGMRIRNRTLILEPTVWNKVTGFLLFLFPLTLSFLDVKYSACVVCTAATVAAVNSKAVKL